MLFYANASAEARGQAPPVRLIDDGVTNVRIAAEPINPQVSPIAAGGYDAYPAQGHPILPQSLPIAWTLRPFDTWQARNLDGNHGVITRVQGTPVGALTPTGSAFRAVFRPLPQAWDAGYQMPEEVPSW